MSRNIRSGVKFHSVRCVEQLEDRCTPVAWPVGLAAGQAPQLIGTYGQYQEVSDQQLVFPGRPPLIVDTSIHLHEGLDIPALAGDAVFAVKAGKIEAIYRSAFAPLASVLVIRDLAGNRGWNYKHVIADAMLKVGDAVNEGAEIGTVAPFPGIYPPHVHLDRGEEPTTVPEGKFRDQSWLKLPAYEQLRENLATALRVLTSPTATTVEKTHAGIVAVDATASLEVLRWHYRPLINPLTEFTGTPAYQDVLAPTIESIAFRVGLDDEAERVREAPNPSSEVRRSDARYFNTTVVVNSIGNQPLPRLGIYASALAQNSRASEPAGTTSFRRTRALISSSTHTISSRPPGTRSTRDSTRRSSSSA